MGHTAPIVGIDIGSSGVRASRFTLDGQPVGVFASLSYRDPLLVVAGRPQAFDMMQCVIDALSKLDCDGVEAVAISVLWQSLLPVDESNRPLDRVTTWEARIDDLEPERLSEKLGTAWSQKDSGSYLHPSYPLAALAASKAGAHRYVDIGSWIVGMLTGTQCGWSEPIASGSGLWSQSSRTWNAEALAALGVSMEQLGEIWDRPIVPQHPHPSLPGGLHKARWLATLPDGLCQNLGLGAVDQDALVATVATSGSLREVTTHERVNQVGGFWRYRCAEDTVATGAAITSVGNTLDWVQRFTGHRVNPTMFERNAPRLPDVTVVPDVFGRRGPDYRWDATASILGLRPRHTLQDVVQAFAVDIWSSYHHFAALMRQSAREPTSVVAAGGVVTAYQWVPQVLADSMNLTIGISDCSQPSLRGAALAAASFMLNKDWSLDLLVEEIASARFSKPRIVQTVDPRPQWLRALRERWAIELAYAGSD